MQVVERRVRLHKIQATFRQSKAIYRAFVGGRGSGKTWVGAYDLIRRAKRNRTYLIASPTGVILGDTTFPTFRAIARDLGVWDQSQIRMAPYPTVTLSTGAVIRFRTAEDPERMRGPNLSGVWLDEASLMIKEAFDICIASLREAGEQGWLTATFTPKGRAHWTWDYFGREPPRPNTELFHASTKDNPFNPPEFYANLKQQYGSGSELTNQELEGKFLDVDETMQIIPTAWARAAQNRWKPAIPQGQILSSLGVDVARGGQDRTVLAPRYGTWWDQLEKYPGKSTPDGPAVAQLVIDSLRRRGNAKALVCLDADAVGSSPLDFLPRLLPGVNLFAVRGGAKVSATDKSGMHQFYNVRAFAYWSLRELLDPANETQIALPPDNDLLVELTAAKYEINLQGIKLEPKDEIIKRIGRSPDCADAVVYSILRGG